VSRPRVAVVGGGLAGITAALHCVDAGCEVVLLEAQPRLGGLTRSYRRGELLVDNGQHVFLRCCTRYRALLDRLGVADRVTLQPRLDLRVLEPGGRAHRLRRTGLPAPLHLAGGLLGYGALAPLQRLRAAQAAVALRGVDAAAPGTDARSFGAWLAEHAQDARAVAALWDLIGVAALNAPAAETSLALAATVFQQALLSTRDAGDVGWSLVPLQELHGDPGGAALTAGGAQVRTGCRIQALEHLGGRWSVVTRDGSATEADAVVLAVPPRKAERLLPPGAVALAPGWAHRLGAVPIVNVHLLYDRTVLEEPFVAALGSPVQWMFDRTAQIGLRTGQCVALSLSVADDLVDLPVARLRALLEPAVAALLPAARDAVVRDVFVTREREATFRPSPGSAAHRPAATTALPGLALAGAWTATGWPATMEGAVRSGETAATAVLTAAARLTAGARA
jgi:squalene-associated FAD-dependent desaturase